MEDPVNPSNETIGNNNTDIQPDQSQQNIIEESNKFNSEYHPNERLDVRLNARLDTTPTTASKPGIVGPTLVVLQWLTYAFWGGTVVSTSALTVALLSFYITGTGFGDFAAYSIAAVLVFLPISIIADIIYGKQEQDRKSGIASVVMIIHAVIFGMYVTGSLISIAFSLVSLMISSADTDGTMITLWSSLIITVLFALIFLRVVLPAKLAGLRRYFIIFMTLVVGVITVLGLIGPVNDARLSRNDRLIESGLPTVSDAVETYAASNKKLPDDLKNLVDLKGDAKKLVDDNLVTYTKEDGPKYSTMNSQMYPEYPSHSETFYYELSVTYTKASSSWASTDKGGPKDYTCDKSSAESSYSTYLYIYSHPAGKQCYKLQTSGSAYATQSSDPSAIFSTQ